MIATGECLRIQVDYHPLVDISPAIYSSGALSILLFSPILVSQEVPHLIVPFPTSCCSICVVILRVTLFPTPISASLLRITNTGREVQEENK